MNHYLEFQYRYIWTRCSATPGTIFESKIFSKAKAFHMASYNGVFSGELKSKAQRNKL